ncbi:MAG: hypothetical protein IKR78_00605 [Dehalococcoidales bacterium]|nr:hypothetical protein [Dehalococcoidales bacterium]
MKIRFLGAHNAEDETRRLPGILLDETIAFDCGSLTRSLSEKELLKVKDVFLTHRHFDHIRDVVTLAITHFQNGSMINIYGNEDTKKAIVTCLYNHILYSDFFKKEVVRFYNMEAGETYDCCGYSIFSVEVNHGVPANGFYVEKDGHSFLYTGDMTVGSVEKWSNIHPDVLITEVTADDAYTEKFRNGPHLTPSLLEEELLLFKDRFGYIPSVYIVHMTPGLEETITSELVELSTELSAIILPAREDLVINL